MIKKVIYKLIELYKGLSVNARASFWFLISAFFQRGISVISTPIFTRLMNASEYGQFNVFYSWYGIVTIFVTLNLYFGVYVRGLIKFEDDKDRFTSSMQGLAVTLIFSWVIIYSLFQGFFNKLFSLTTYQMVGMFFIICGNSAFSFWAAEQRVLLKYRSLVGFSMLTALLMPVSQIGLMFVIPDKVMARILGMVFVEIIFYTPLFFKQMHKGKVFFCLKYWRYAIAFSIPLIPHYLSQTVLNSADRIMINDMIGSAEAGIYSLAYSVSQIMTVFNSALMQTIEPWLYKKIRDNEAGEISKVAYPAFIIVAVANILLITFAPEVIAIFAPEEYHAAIWIIPPVAMSVFFMFTYTFFAVFEFYYEKTKYITAATLIGAVINVILNYIFIKLYGYYAAAYTTLLCYILYSVFHFMFMKKLIKDNLDGINVYDIKILLFIVLAFCVSGFALLATYNLLIIRYTISIVILIIILIKRKKILKVMNEMFKLKKKNK